MGIDVSRMMSEGMIDVQQARAEFEALSGEPVSQCTISRWINHGCYGVKLEAVRVGKKYRTTKSSILKFVEEINK